jgi:hypothetical protein
MLIALDMATVFRQTRLNIRLWCVATALFMSAFPYCTGAWTDVFGIQRSVHFLPSPLACPLISCPYYVWLPAEPRTEKVLHRRWNWMSIRKATKCMEFIQLSADISSSFRGFRHECFISHEIRFLKKNNKTYYHFYCVLRIGMQRDAWGLSEFRNPQWHKNLDAADVVRRSK